MTTAAPFQDNADDSFSIYKITFFWYAPFGLILTFISGVLLSCIFATDDHFKQLNITLISPISHWLVPKKYRHHLVDDRRGVTMEVVI